MDGYMSSIEFKEQAGINDRQFDELIIRGFIKSSRTDKETNTKLYGVDDLLDKIKSGRLIWTGNTFEESS